MRLGSSVAISSASSTEMSRAFSVGSAYLRSLDSGFLFLNSIASYAVIIIFKNLSSDNHRLSALLFYGNIFVYNFHMFQHAFVDFNVS
jgi:hypothetical protein